MDDTVLDNKPDKVHIVPSSLPISDPTEVDILRVVRAYNNEISEIGARGAVTRDGLCT